MITYLDYTLVPLPCPRTQHSRLFLSRKPLTLKIRSSAIPFLWKRVNNMFQRDWKVIFFFYQKPCTSKLPSTVRSKQTLCLHRKWPELPDQDWNPDFSIWSPSLQTQGDHNSHVTWSSLHWKKSWERQPTCWWCLEATGRSAGVAFTDVVDSNDSESISYMWRQCNLYPSFLRFRSVRNNIPRRRSKLCRVLDYHFLYWTAVRFSEDPCDVDVFAFSVSLTDGHICRWIRRTLKYRHIWLLTREGRETDHWIFHHTNYEHIFTTLSFPLTSCFEKT